MKKLIIISDTHGSRRGIDGLLALIEENDYLVHLGDGAGDVRELSEYYRDKVYVCAGNCDFFSPLPTEGVLEIEGVKIFYCHGHKYGVKREFTELSKSAKARGCSVALYGHTHVARIDEIDGVTLINPGSLRAPVDRGGSYCYLVLHQGKVTPMLVGESVY